MLVSVSPSVSPSCALSHDESVYYVELLWYTVVSGENRAQDPAPSPSPGRAAGVQCPPFPYLSRQRVHPAASAFLLNGSFRIRRGKGEEKKKKDKNPTHFSELLSQFPFIPGMMAKCASQAASPQTAFQPHFLRADAGGAPRPLRGTQPCARRPQLFPALPGPRRRSRRCPRPPSGRRRGRAGTSLPAPSGGGGGADLRQVTGAPPPALTSPGRWRCFPLPASGTPRRCSPPGSSFPPPLPPRRLTRRQQISSGSSRCSGAASPRSSSAPVTPLPAPCPAPSPRPLQLSPPPPPARPRRRRAAPLPAPGGARQPGRAAAGGCLRSPSYPAGLPLRLPPGTAPRGQGPGCSPPPPPPPPSALGTARRTGRRRRRLPRGATEALRGRRATLRGGVGAGLSAGANLPPAPRLREAVRRGGKRRPRSPTRRRRRGLPGPAETPHAARRARSARPGSQRPRQAAAESAARHGPTRARRPGRPGASVGRAGRGAPLPLPTPRGGAAWTPLPF